LATPNFCEGFKETHTFAAKTEETDKGKRRKLKGDVKRDVIMKRPKGIDRVYD
jgi:hypothetical protein